MFKRATMPLVIVFVLGVLAFAQEFVPHPISAKFREEMSMGMLIIAGFGLFIGIYSLAHLHVTRIRRQTRGWGYSIFVFIGAIAMIFVGLYNEGKGPLPPPPSDGWFTWGYRYVFNPCQATIFSILAFFMASAAFRTFRARNTASTLLLIAAIIVMFGRVPVSETVSLWLFGHGGVFSRATDIIMNYPNLAAQRAIILGINLGLISQSLRILFGIERSYLGGGD